MIRSSGSVDEVSAGAPWGKVVNAKTFAMASSSLTRSPGMTGMAVATSSQVARTAPGSGWAETMRNMLATMSAAAGCSLRASLLTHYATHSLGLGSGGYGVLLTAAPADW